MLKRTTVPYFAPVLGLTLMILLGLGSFSTEAFAQDELDDSSAEPEGDVAEPSTPMAEEIDLKSEIRHGVGLRLRYIFVPKALIELFVEESPSGVSQSGFGLEYVRRKKDFEFSVGFEYDALSADNGYFVERGGAPTMPGTTDFIEFDGLAWYTLDAAFVYHHKLNDLVALRYGGGIGLSIVTGEIIQTDAICNGNDTQDDCSRVPAPIPGGEFNTKQDFFRFPPVFSALGGVQLTPARNIAVNIELGMRTVFYTGVGVQYFF